MSKPIPVIPLDYARPSATNRLSPTLAGLVLAAWIACAVAWAFIVFVDVESVLVTGPIITILGLMLITTGVDSGRRVMLLLGVADVAVCLLFLLLVLGTGWGPGEAEMPFAVMGGAYAAITAVPTFWLLFRPSRSDTYRQP